MAVQDSKRNKDKQNADAITEFTDIVGGCGRWQLQIFMLCFVTAFAPAFHNLVMNFTAPDVDHWCARSEEAIRANISVEIWKEKMIPTERTQEGEIRYSRCDRYDVEFNITNFWISSDKIGGDILSVNNSNSGRIPCQKWEYDDSFYPSTVVSQWDLVCDREWLVSGTKSIYNIAFLITAFVNGQLSDKIGRRSVLLLSLVILLASGTICAFSVSFTMFMVCRFFVAFGGSCIFSTVFVMMVEVVGARHRSLFGISVEFGWSTAYVLLPGIAWIIRDWFWIQLALTIPCIALLILWWNASESPRWLITQGKWDRVQKILITAAKKNGKDANNVKDSLQKLCDQSIKAQGNEPRKGNILDLFRTPELRDWTLTLYFIWFVNAFIYYGLTYNMADLGGDLFINFALSGAVEFPAYFLTIIVVKKLGRRIPLMATMVCGGMACILTMPIPEEMMWLRTTLAMCGKFCITSSFAIIFVHSAEIYPTVVRNVGVGSCSTVSRIGSILAPFVKELDNATHPAVPLACYGGLSIVSGLLALRLPETSECKVPDTIEEAAQIRKKRTKEEEHSMKKLNRHHHEDPAYVCVLATESLDREPKCDGHPTFSKNEDEEKQLSAYSQNQNLAASCSSC